MYCLRLFIVVLQEVHSMFTINFLVCPLKNRQVLCFSELHDHLCSYRNVCRLLLFYKNYIVYQNFNMTMQWLSWSSSAKFHFLTLNGF